jgi:type IV pilus assembly protein PilW
VTSHPQIRQAGFTIVELMVGVLVGLIATVVMFQVFAISEGQKRTTTGAGDAQQNGVASVFQIERDARMAGYGLSYNQMLGCVVNAWNEDANAAFSFRMAPFLITDGGVNPDTITFAFGDSRAFTSPEKLNQDMAGPSVPFRVYNRFGFSLGDLVIAVEDAKPCTLYQVSALPGIPNIDNIGHLPGSYLDPQGVTRSTSYNRTGGVPPGTTYAQWNRTTRKGGRLINLGQNPTIVTYGVANNQLIATDGLIPGSAPVVISDGIVNFQVQYGFDANGDGNITGNLSTAVLNPALGDQWADALPAAPTTAMFQGIVAVRFAIASRSMTPEKPVAGACTATPAAPMWLAKGVPIDVTGGAIDWMCYRYRVFEITVPARNIAWSPNEGA